MGDNCIQFCCERKKKSLKSGKIFQDVTINPRIVVFDGQAKGKSSSQIVKIKNEFSESIDFTVQCDFPKELLKMIVIGNTTLAPQKHFTIEICYKRVPDRKNFHFSVYVSMIHPNASFYIPVIIQQEGRDLSFPSRINFPVVSPGVYGFCLVPMCNFLKRQKQVTAKIIQNVNSRKYNLRFTPEVFILEPNSFIVMFLEVLPEDEHPIDAVMEFCSKGVPCAYVDKRTAQIFGFVGKNAVYVNEFYFDFDTIPMGGTEELNVLLCCEGKEEMKFKWCRKEKKDGCTEISDINFGKDVLASKGDESCEKRKWITDDFCIIPKSGKLMPNTSKTITFRFHPVTIAELSGFEEKPKLIHNYSAVAFLATSTSEERKKFLFVGKATPPMIRFVQTEFDLGDIFVGDRNCIEVKAQNLNKYPGEIVLKAIDGCFDSAIQLKKSSILFQPCECKEFSVEYYATKPGKFIETLIYKVKYNEDIKFVLKGVAIPFEICVYPEKVEFGSITLCTLYHKTISFKNTFRSPVYLTFSVDGDGDEDPLVIFTKKEFIKEKGNLELNASHGDVCKMIQDTQCNSVLLATKLIRRMKNSNTGDNVNTDELINTIVEEVLGSELYEKIYDDMYFLKGDWMELPSNPREFFISDTTHFLKPGERGEITLSLVANKPGLYVKDFLMITRICEEDGKCTSCYLKSDVQRPVVDRTLNVAHFTKRVPIEYDCRVPNIEQVPSILEMNAVVDHWEKFTIKIQNSIYAYGFIYISEIPKSEYGEMRFNTKKFLIHSCSSIDIPGEVIVYRTEETQFFGMIGVLGSSRMINLRVVVRAEPPKIKIIPEIIVQKQKILEERCFKLTIRNVSKTFANITLILNGKYLSWDKEEEVIDPKSEKNIVIKSKFYDPDIYNLSILVHLKHYGNLKIPAKFITEGIPLIFEPNIIANFNFGSEFIKDTPFIREILIRNAGYYSYHLGLPKMKTKKVEEGFQFSVESIEFKPGELKSCNLFIKNVSKSMDICQKLPYIISCGKNSIQTIKGTSECKVRLIRPSLKWNKDSVKFSMLYNEVKEKAKFLERVEIINLTKLKMELKLEISGPFSLETRKTKCLDLILVGKGKETLLVNFNREEIPDITRGGTYGGQIIPKLQNIVQPGIILSATIVTPKLTIKEEESCFFSQKLPFYFFFQIENTGSLPADYSWILQKQLIETIDQALLDDQSPVESVADCILNKVPLNLLNLPNFENKSIEELQNIMDAHEEDDSDMSDGEMIERAQRLLQIEMCREAEEIRKQLEEECKPKKKVKKKKGTKKTIKKKDDQEKLMALACVEAVIKAQKIRRNRMLKIIKSRNSQDIDVSSSPDIEYVIEKEISINDIVDEIAQHFPVDIEEQLGKLPNSLTSAYEESEDNFIDLLKNIKYDKGQVNLLFLSEYNGNLPMNYCRYMNGFFPGFNKNAFIKITFNLETPGKGVESLNVTVCNADINPKMSVHEFNLGRQPWYRIHHRSIILENLNDTMSCILSVLQFSHLGRLDEYLKGFINVTPMASQSVLLSNHSQEFYLTIYAGINGLFKNGFGIEINYRIPIPVTTVVDSLIPTLSILNLPRRASFTQKKSSNVMMQYEMLRELYYSQIEYCAVEEQQTPSNYEIENFLEDLKMLNEEEYEFESCGEEDTTEEIEEQTQKKSHKKRRQTEGDINENKMWTTGKEKNYNLMERFPEDLKLRKLQFQMINDSTTFISYKKFQHSAAVISKCDQDLQDYIVLDYPEEYPGPVEIEFILLTKDFTNQIYSDIFVRKRFLDLFQRRLYVHVHSPIIYPIRELEPLPFQSPFYILNFGGIPLGESTERIIKTFYHGPGPANFLIRSETYLPNFSVNFLLPPECRENSSYGMKKYTLTNFTLKKTALDISEYYLNRRQRNEMIFTCPTSELALLKCNGCEECTKCTGSRSDNATCYKRKKMINEYYNKFKKNELDLRKRFTLAELRQNNCDDVSEKVFEFQINFNPDENYYKVDQCFDDYLYIDIHLGSTVPILMRGTFIK